MAEDPKIPAIAVLSFYIFIFGYW